MAYKNLDSIEVEDLNEPKEKKDQAANEAEQIRLAEEHARAQEADRQKNEKNDPEKDKKENQADHVEDKEKEADKKPDQKPEEKAQKQEEAPGKTPEQEIEELCDQIEEYKKEYIKNYEDLRNLIQNKDFNMEEAEVLMAKLESGTESIDKANESLRENVEILQAIDDSLGEPEAVEKQDADKKEPEKQDDLGKQKEDMEAVQKIAEDKWQRSENVADAQEIHKGAGIQLREIESSIEFNSIFHESLDVMKEELAQLKLEREKDLKKEEPDVKRVKDTSIKEEVMGRYSGKNEERNREKHQERQSERKIEQEQVKEKKIKDPVLAGKAMVPRG